MKFYPLLSCLAFLTFLASVSSLMADNLFPEGSFEILGAEGEPESWSLPHPNYLAKIQADSSLETENGNRFLRLSLENPENANLATAKIPIPDDAANVVITYRVRCTNLTPADVPSWSGVFNGGGFLDGAEQSLELFRGVKRLKESTDGWVDVEEVFQVPVGAKMVLLQPGIYHCTGTADFDDFVVTVE